MKRIIVYLIFCLCVLIYLSSLALQNILPEWLEKIELAYLCSIMGGIGGCVYCLRGIYINACVRKSWDDNWQPWYYIRPIVSIACGGVSYLFLRAGLLILEANERQEATNLGFLALAFIAGLNVDKFINKIEDVAMATWGIEKSRTSTNNKNEN